MNELSPTDALKTASRISVICVGDVMLDRFIYGDVARISPEAPVPILRQKRITAMPGGAANVARNLASLGSEVSLIGVRGDDTEAGQLADLIAQTAGISADLVAAPGRPTTLKTRYVAGGQQLMRVDSEEVSAIAADTQTAVIAALKAAASQANAIILSDYAKGVLTDPIIEAALRLGQARGIPVIVDPKGRDFARYGAVDVIKPNSGELSAAVDLPTETDRDIEAALIAALEKCSAKAIVVTRAAKGMSCVARGGNVEHYRGEARDVYDVSGAGDTSIASLSLGIASGVSLADSVKLAIAASGLAVGKFGTATVTADEVLTAIRIGLNSGGLAHTPLADMVVQVNAWRDAGFAIGFTNGCFDILHPGHLKVLEEAKARCGRLIVGLNSDASVARLKGPNRPVNDAASRARVLKGLSAVDAVVVFEEDTPAELISALSPDLLVKGGDYTVETIVGAEDVIRKGGAVHIVPLVEGQSTTAAIARAKS